MNIQSLVTYPTCHCHCLVLTPRDHRFIPLPRYTLYIHRHAWCWYTIPKYPSYTASVVHSFHFPHLPTSLLLSTTIDRRILQDSLGREKRQTRVREEADTNGRNANRTQQNRTTALPKLGVCFTACYSSTNPHSSQYQYNVPNNQPASQRAFLRTTSRRTQPAHLLSPQLNPRITHPLLSKPSARQTLIMCGDSHLPPAPESGDLIAIIHPYTRQSTFQARLRLSNRFPGATTSTLTVQDANSVGNSIGRDPLLNVRIQ